MGKNLTISAEEVKRRLDKGEVRFMFDLRNADEFAAWSIEGRSDIETLNMPQVSARLRVCMVICPSSNAVGRKLLYSAEISKRMAGMANGICALTLTTALYWVRQAIPNAGLIRLLKVGLFSPEPGILDAHIWQWKRSIGVLFDGTMA
jgi:hypothetical protein